MRLITRVLLPGLAPDTPPPPERRTPGRAMTVRVTAIQPCEGGFTVRYTYHLGGPERSALLPLPLPDGAAEYLRQAGDVCSIRLIEGVIVDVGA